MGVVHASRGALAPASPQLLSEVAIVVPAGPARSSGDATPSTGTASSGDYDAHPRPHRARSIPGFDDFNDAGARPRRLRAAARAARRAPASRRRPARPDFTVNPLDVARGCRPAGCCCRRSAPTTSTTPRSTASTTATAASTAAGGSCSSTPTTSPRSASPTATIVDLVSEFDDGVERRRRALPGRRLPDRARRARPYFPEANVLVPLDSTADRQRHADVEVDRSCASNACRISDRDPVPSAAGWVTTSGWRWAAIPTRCAGAVRTLDDATRLVVRPAIPGMLTGFLLIILVGALL